MQEMTLQQIQAVQMEALRFLSKICDQEKIEYFLMYGTLLGAVRHKGFIPWDDDLDIMLRRSEYDRLLQYLMQHEQEILPYRLFCHLNCPDYPFMIARLCDTRYQYVPNNEKDCGMGIFIDLYPLDGAGHSWEEVRRRGPYLRLLSSLCFLSSREHFFVSRLEYSSRKSFVRTAIKFPLYLIAKAAGTPFWLWKLERLPQQYRYADCPFVGPTSWLGDYRRDVMDKSWVEQTTWIEFEGEKFRAPKEYHKVLWRKYGDYMQLPAADRRVATHDYRAYRKERL